MRDCLSDLIHIRWALPGLRQRESIEVQGAMQKRRRETDELLSKLDFMQTLDLGREMLETAAWPVVGRRVRGEGVGTKDTIE